MKSLQKEVNSLLLPFTSKYFFQAQQCCIYLRAAAFPSRQSGFTAVSQAETLIWGALTSWEQLQEPHRWHFQSRSIHTAA